MNNVGVKQQTNKMTIQKVITINKNIGRAQKQPQHTLFIQDSSSLRNSFKPSKKLSGKRNLQYIESNIEQARQFLI
jgi:hypothetical protein